MATKMKASRVKNSSKSAYGFKKRTVSSGSKGPNGGKKGGKKGTKKGGKKKPK